MGSFIYVGMLQSQHKVDVEDKNRLINHGSVSEVNKQNRDKNIERH